MVLAIALGGCAVSPKPISSQEVAGRLAADRVRMFADQAPVSGQISLAEASARAIRFNLDHRLKAMEETLALGQLEVTKWDMFPRLLANAGYTNRSNDLSYVSSAGLTSTTTLERSRRLASVEFSWNVLDLGTSYYRARMAADQVLVAEERKRKAIQNLMQDVRAAYWRALGAQRLVHQLDALMLKSKVALGRARQIEQQGLMPQAQALAYQRALLDSTVLLSARRQDLDLAKLELGSLMNLPPGSDFRLLDVADPVLPDTPQNFSDLEAIALAQRPELREEDYRKRISVNDARRALAATLPGISLDFATQYDSNRFLLNNSWTESALRLSMSLFRMAAIPAINRQRDAQLGVDDVRRMAQAMAAITQLRVAAQRYGLAREELDQVNASADVDQRLASYARSASSSRVDSELELIRTEARAMLSQFQRTIAYANAQAAYGRLFNTLGLDVRTPPEGADLGETARHVEQSLDEWRKITFESNRRSTADLPQISLRFDGAHHGKAASAMRLGATTALARYDLKTGDTPSAWRLVVTLAVESDHQGQHRANWQLRLLRPDNSLAQTTHFSSPIPADPRPSLLNALTQSAIDAGAAQLLESMSPPPKVSVSPPDEAGV